VSFWAGRRVLVTGAGGFIGSWLTRRLVEEGARVTALLLPQDAGDALELHGVLGDVAVVRGDLAEGATVPDVDACFHLAAQPIVGIANDSPVPTFRSNVAGTWNLLEALRVAGTATRIVVASSDKAYGDQPELPYREEMPLAAAYPYDASKACTDILARVYARTYGLPVAVTRLANVYGGGDRNLSRIVPGTIASLLRGEPPVVRSDGTPTRDYLYVEDAVEGTLLLGEKIGSAGVGGEAFNFGTGAPVRALDLVRLIVERAGIELEPVVQDEATGEIDAQSLDSSKAQALLGWRPEVALTDGLDRTIAWYREHAAVLA
jgi:CDP-glucose 4,6-dehydratase